MADMLPGSNELKKAFQSGNSPTPEDFGRLIDAADAARQALGLTSPAPVRDGLTPGAQSGLVYDKGHLTLALGAGLTLDPAGRLTFDSKTEQAIRADQSKKDKVNIRQSTGYVAQVMYAATQVSMALFAPENNYMGSSKVNKASGIRFNAQTSAITFEKPQYAFQWVRLDDHAWSWDKNLNTLVTSLNPNDIEDQGKTVPSRTLKSLAQNTGALLCFGTEDALRKQITAQTLIIAFHEGNLVAAGGWSLDSTTSLKVNYAKWQNFLQP